nr:TPA_exp: holocytochrome c synthase [Chlorokybus atmophyticus]
MGNAGGKEVLPPPPPPPQGATTNPTPTSSSSTSSSASTAGSSEVGGGGSKSVPEKVHELYYRVFPGANCPVTGGAPSASNSDSDSDSDNNTKQQQDVAAPDDYEHPYQYNVYGQRVDPAAKLADASPPERLLAPPSWVYAPAILADKMRGGGGGQRQGVERINPANMMPLEPNQRPSPDQQHPLSRDRERSSIPKAGTRGETWTYPSPQMFFNSLKRKGKADDITEADMEVVVATHNTMNELTWQRALEWESLYSLLRPDLAPYPPKLLHFRGRPHDLSPKARVYTLLGLRDKPFDRHDWVIDRGGREFRYVIDFYFDEGKAGTNEAFNIDVRPALDSPQAAWLRVRMGVEGVKRRLGLSTVMSAKERGEDASAGVGNAESRDDARA